MPNIEKLTLIINKLKVLYGICLLKDIKLLFCELD